MRWLKSFTKYFGGNICLLFSSYTCITKIILLILFIMTNSFQYIDHVPGDAF